MKVPIILFVVDDKIISSHIGTFVSRSNSFVPMIRNRVEALKQIYSSGIDDVMNRIEDLKK